jgi:uncharacterized membrane protein
VVTVIAGLAYWGNIVATDAHNGDASSGMAMASFFLIWTITWALLYALLIPGKGVLDKGPVLAFLVAIIVIAAAWLFLVLNDHGWESNRLLAIGVGGGIGWVMLLNVWGIIWPIQKRLIQWTAENASHGTNGISDFANQRIFNDPAVVLHGRSQPLPDVRQMMALPGT